MYANEQHTNESDESVRSINIQFATYYRIRSLEVAARMIRENGVNQSLINQRNFVAALPLEKNADSIHNFTFANLVLQFLEIVAQA